MNPPSETKGTKWQVSKPNGQGDGHDSLAGPVRTGHLAVGGAFFGIASGRHGWAWRCASTPPTRPVGGLCKLWAGPPLSSLPGLHPQPPSGLHPGLHPGLPT